MVALVKPMEMAGNEVVVSILLGFVKIHGVVLGAGPSTSTKDPD
jgi:hypothetical protein